MTEPDNYVRLKNAGLQERNGEIVAHGWLDIASMDKLKVDDYQREILAAAGNHKTPLQRAVGNGALLPDIVLGMRGQDYKTHGDNMTLLGKVYIVDGLQRVFALKAFAEANPDKADTIMIGAEVRFDTTRHTEMELFRALNMFRIPVSPNVILRNARHKHPSVLTLYGLSMSDADSPLFKRVTWTQRMARGELFTATMIAKIARAVHLGANARSKGRGKQKLKGGADTGSRNLPLQLDGIAEKVTLRTYRQNIITFFELVDSCYGIANIEYRQTATQTKGNFLSVLARILASYENFWDGNRLVVNAADRRKFATFPLRDPDVIRLAAAGNMAQQILEKLITDHFNKGKKSNRLVPRKPVD